MADPEVVEDKQEESQETEAKEKPKKKPGGGGLNLMVIVAIVAILVAVVAAFLLVKALTPKPEVVDEKTAEMIEELEKVEPEKEKVSSAKEVGELYEFENAVVVNIAETNAERYLKVNIVLELDSAKLKDEIEKRKPQIMDLFINIFASKTLDMISTVSGRNLVRQELIDKVNARIKTGRIVNIFFTEFVIQ